jgi:predicted MPP superfamily phosphohydrolase
VSKQWPVARLVTFIAVAFALLAGIHYYLWARLVRDPRWPASWTTVGGTLLALLALSVPLSLILGRAGQAGVRQTVVWTGYIWLGLMFLLLTTVFFSDLLRLLGAFGRRLLAPRPFDPQRRLLIARSSAAVSGILASSLGAVGLSAVRKPVDVRRVEVRLDRLPLEQHGLRIVQLTDIHVGPTIGRDFVEQIVARTNALVPDLIAITGDLVDGSVAHLAPAIAPLAGLRAPHGVFFVTGNHEYFSGAQAWMNELRRLGIRVLRNERISIGNGTAGFDLAGVDDRSSERYGGLAPLDALRRALGDRDPSRELVLLAHQPRTLLDAEPFGVGLQLSGHTHGGQMWPFNFIVQLQQPFIAGLHRRGGTQIYVSRGTGYWGPPMRLGAPAEITEIRLLSGAAADRAPA